VSSRQQPSAPPPRGDRITQTGRIVGLGGIVLSALVWYFTNRISIELIGVFGSLWGFTEGAAALKELGRK
jgi:hypothetical protein